VRRSLGILLSSVVLLWLAVGAYAAEGSPGEKEAVALYRQGRAAEAVTAFDRLLAEKPDDVGLKIWKALALLEQAARQRAAKGSGHKSLVTNAYAILRPLGRSQASNPDWNLAMAKALWLNDRSERATRVAAKSLELRANFPEAHLLLGDIAYEDGIHASADRDQARRELGRWQGAQISRRAYEAALALPDLPFGLRAEALYKLGMVSASLEKKEEVARDYWEKAAAAEPASRYGGMAREKLKRVPAK
jgi:tetratricopeptide (TPR) repeat protein